MLRSPLLAARAATRITTRQASLTKLVATIGPASEEAEPLQKCVAAGMHVMRLNFSHATPEEFFLRVNNLAASEGGEYVAKLLDTRGPEVRLGGLAICKQTDNRKAKVLLEQGNELKLTTDPKYDGAGDEKTMYVNYERIAAKVKVRSRRPAAPSRHLHESSPGMMEVGGLFFDFGAVRTASRDAPRR
jgi:pyruvate kinase